MPRAQDVPHAESCRGTRVCSVASGAPPTVDAGPNKILALAAKDLTLLGYATDPENNPLTVLWTLASGPAAVSFSAPTALTTTVTFTATGTYTFQLTVSDGTSTVTDNVVVDGAEQIHPGPQWQGVARQGLSSARQCRQAFAERRVEPFDIGGVDHLHLTQSKGET